MSKKTHEKGHEKTEEKLSDTDIIELMRDFGKNTSFLKYITGTNYFTENILDLYPDAKWDWTAVSAHKNISFLYIVRNLKYPWNWTEISRRATWKDISENIKLDWNWDAVCTNPNITEEIVKNNPKVKWNWFNLSVNTNISFGFIKENKKDWDYDMLSRRKDLPIDFILSNLKKYWTWGAILERQDLSFTTEQIEFLAKNSDIFKIDFNVYKFIQNPKTSWIHIKVLYDYGYLNIKDDYWDIKKLIKDRKDITYDVAKSMSNFEWDWKNLQNLYKSRKLEVIAE